MIKAFASSLLTLLVLTGPAFAQDAMSPAAMNAPAMGGDAMAAPMTDDQLNQCLDQAGSVTFQPAMQAASDACHAMHNGAMGGSPMGGDAMSGGAMNGMTPAQ